MKGVPRIVKAFFKAAGITPGAAVAYVRGSQQSAAGFILEIFAESVAHAASPAQGVFTFRVAGRADVAPGAVKTHGTGIVTGPHAADPPEYKM